MSFINHVKIVIMIVGLCALYSLFIPHYLKFIMIKTLDVNKT